MKIILIAIIQLTSQLLFASGSTIGNGGNSIICKNATGQITSVEILDLYEARLNGLTLKLNPQLSNYKDILSANLNRWESVAPYRVAQYKKWLSDFESETLIISGDIPVIPDTGSVILPMGCELKPIAFQRRESELLPGVKRYTINKALWNLMDEVQKAGLVQHELIYREGIKVGHKTSFPTRYFNGYLSTAEPKSETYASIVSRLPLDWTEYNGMLIDVLFRPFNTIIIQENGQLNAFVSKFYGPVDTKNFSITGGAIRYSDDNEPILIKYDGMNFILGDNKYNTWKAQKVRASSDRYNLEFDLTDYDFMRALAIKVGKIPWFTMNCLNCAGKSTVKMNNPLENWILTNNSKLIKNIIEIKFKRLNQDFGMEIMTTTGEKWAWDMEAFDYVMVK